MNTSVHNEYMIIALEEAKKSTIDVPVGALIVKDGEIIAKAHNLKEQNEDSTDHAEIIAIKQASKKLNNWRLEDCVMYVTLEPCPMCAAAILYSRISTVVFGAYDPSYGALGSAMNLSGLIKRNPVVIGGIMEEESTTLLKNFFKLKRDINE